MIYRTDYHMHTTFSDGRAEAADYVKAAISAGLSEIGFSEHLTPGMQTEHWNMDPSLLPAYMSRVAELKECTEGIKVRCGLEVDYFEGREEITRKILDSLDLDYVIGSVHYKDGVTVDMGREYYEGKDIDALFGTYFDMVCSAVESGLFDIIGHCDLIRIFGFRPTGDPEPLYRKIAGVMKQYDVAFEVNTNGRNRPLADFYPDRRYLNVFREAGVPVCVNSDAHMPGRVAQYFDEAYDLLRNAGFTEMAVFEKRKRMMVPF